MAPSDIYDFVVQLVNTPDITPEQAHGFAKWLLQPWCPMRRLGPNLWRVYP